MKECAQYLCYGEIEFVADDDTYIIQKCSKCGHIYIYKRLR